MPQLQFAHLKLLKIYYGMMTHTNLFVVQCLNLHVLWIMLWIIHRLLILLILRLGLSVIPWIHVMPLIFNILLMLVLMV
jgi:hypothetical protein